MNSRAICEDCNKEGMTGEDLKWDKKRETWAHGNCHPLNSLSTGFNVKITFHTNEAHDKIKSEAFVREKIGAIFDTHGVQEEIDYTLEVRRLYE